jgi:serine/threonine protein kinase
MLELDGYTTEKEIGRAPRSTLYLGKRTEDGASVILKEYVIPSNSGAEFEEKAAARYSEECDWLQSIEHPNIVRVIETVKPSSICQAPVLVTELLDITLEQMLQENDRLPHEEVVAWLVQLLAGVEAFHQHHILHRDIKPANVMLNDSGTPKIIDLGIAVKLGNEITLRQDDISTKYAAPEMYRGRSGANFATDIYSLGFMCYEMLAGRSAFLDLIGMTFASDDREQLLRWMNWHCDETSTLPPLHDIAQDVPEYLCDIIDKMSTKRLSARYQTSDEVLHDIARGCRTNRDVYSLIIRQHIPSNYWQESAQYKLLEEDEEETIEESEEIPKSPTSSRTKHIGLATAIVLAILLCGGITGYFVIQKLNRDQIRAELNAYYDAALQEFDIPDYPGTRGVTGEANSYIQQLRNSTDWSSATALFDLVTVDANWIESLGLKLEEARAALEVEDLEIARENLSAIMEEKYEQDSRDDRLHGVTHPQFAEIQAEASDLLNRVLEKQEAIRVAMEEAQVIDDTARVALAQGKHRQAYYEILTALSPDGDDNPLRNMDLVRGSIQSLFQEVSDIVRTLNAGRQAYDQRELEKATVEFGRAYQLSGKKSIEALYFLLRVDFELRGLLSPSEYLESPELQGNETLEFRLFRVMATAVDLLIRRVDLAQPDTNDELAGITSMSDSLSQQLLVLVQSGPSGESSKFFGLRVADMPEEIVYPIEESQEYFINRFSELMQLDIRLSLASGDAERAHASLQDVMQYLPAPEGMYYEALINGLVGDPEASIKAYEQLMSNHPGWTGECKFRIAMIHRSKLDDLGTCLELLGEAVNVQPANERYRWWGARTADNIAAQLVGEDRLEDARKYCEVARDFWPDYPLSWLAQANTYRGEEDKEKIRECLINFKEAYENRKVVFADEDESWADESWQELAKNLSN